jgi:dihydrofolate reductase
MTLSLIAAVARNGTIGRDNQVPWRLPVDMQWFKRWTWGHTVLLGRRTFESIGGKPLPGRTNIVVTGREDFAPPGVTVARSVEEALAVAAREDPDGEVFVVGGQEMYRATLPLADRIYLTRVHADVPGDTLFPPFDESEFEVVMGEDHPADAGTPLAFTFLIYQRKRRELDEDGIEEP